MNDDSTQCKLSIEEALARADRLTGFYDDEDVVAKLHSLQELERHNPYDHGVPGSNYWARVLQAQAHIPDHFSRSFIALMANVVYVTKPVIHSARSHLVG